MSIAAGAIYVSGIVLGGILGYSINSLRNAQKDKKKLNKTEQLLNRTQACFDKAKEHLIEIEEFRRKIIKE